MKKEEILAYLKIQENDVLDALRESDLVEDILREPNPENLSLAKSQAIIAGVALHIQSLYTGLELVLKNTLQKIDGATPDGEAWHVQLLKQAQHANEYRNPLLSQESFDAMNELRGFRHVVRNLYGTALKQDRVLNMADVAKKLTVTFMKDWNALKQYYENNSIQNEQGGASPNKRGPHL